MCPSPGASAAVRGIGRSKVTLLGYGLLTADAQTLVQALSSQRFSVILVDEAHYLKSRTSARSKILVPMIQRSKRAVLLTGTPALGRPEETNWDLFEHQDLEMFTEAVLDYIKFCMGNVTVNKTIRVFPNQKPWMSKQVRTLLQARDAAFRSGDRALYSAARADLEKGIKRAKKDHKRRTESHMSSNNHREMWRSIQNITNYRGCSATATGLSATLAEELNCFFARFDNPPSAPGLNSPPLGRCVTPALLPPLHRSDTSPFTVQEHEVRRVLLSVNPRKATGPDGVPGKHLLPPPPSSSPSSLPHPPPPPPLSPTSPSSLPHLTLLSPPPNPPLSPTSPSSLPHLTLLSPPPPASSLPHLTPSLPHLTPPLSPT
uniref:Helicase ATP-binding domain-containing protein n=1 Tax=Knipowitschia caucasica TaxID=637954 RepID=A0AAV2LE96_KNICA